MVGDRAALTYTIPMPSDGLTDEAAPVLDFIKAGVPTETRTTRVGLGAVAYHGTQVYHGATTPRSAASTTASPSAT